MRQSIDGSFYVEWEAVEVSVSAIGAQHAGCRRRYFLRLEGLRILDVRSPLATKETAQEPAPLLPFAFSSLSTVFGSFGRNSIINGVRHDPLLLLSLLR
jgi:hypothetical protein